MVQAYRRVRAKADPIPAKPAENTELPLRRNSPEYKAERARVLLDDPRLRAVFDEARQEALTELESVKMDGSRASEEQVLEKVRQLQALMQVKRIILRPLLDEQNHSGGSPA